MPLFTFTQTFTASGSWTAPDGLAGPPAVYVWGPPGTAAAGTAGTGAGGGGAGGLGGESSLGGVSAGTVLTVTISAVGSGTASTVTGGSVTVTGNAGGNASTGTGGTAGAASTNTVTFAGGAGGNGAAGASGGGGGGGGSPGTTGAGGAGSPGVSATGGAGGTAGTGPAGLAGATGGAGGTGSSGGAGGVPSAAGGGGSGGAIHAGGTSQPSQAVILWAVWVPGLAATPRRRPARALWRGPAAAITPAAPLTPAPASGFLVSRLARSTAVWGGLASSVVAPTGLGTPASGFLVTRRASSTAVWGGYAAVSNIAVVSFAVPAPPQQPGPAPRRRLARAYVRFTPVVTVNAAAPVAAGGGPRLADSDRPWLKRRRAKWYRHGPTLDYWYGAEIPAGVGSAYLASGGLAAFPGPDETDTPVAAGVTFSTDIPDTSPVPDQRLWSRAKLGERIRGSNRPGRPVWTRDAVVPAAGGAFDEQRSERLVNSYRLARPGWRSTREYPLPVVQRRK